MPTRKYLIAFLALSLVLLSPACSLQDFLPLVATPTPTAFPDDCKANTEPTGQDIEYSLGFAGDIFQKPEWERSYTVGNMRTSVSWLSKDQAAVAYLEYVIFSCGYTQAELDAYYSEETFSDVLFAQYANLHLEAMCGNKEGDLSLRQYTADLEDEGYNLFYWIKEDTGTRVLAFLLSFPQTSAELDKYAREVFPELSSCPQ